MTLAILVGAVLAATAVADVRAHLARRQWAAAALSAGLWALAGAGTVAGAAGFELPSLSALVVRLLRPGFAWIP